MYLTFHRTFHCCIAYRTLNREPLTPLFYFGPNCFVRFHLIKSTNQRRVSQTKHRIIYQFLQREANHNSKSRDSLMIEKRFTIIIAFEFLVGAFS